MKYKFFKFYNRPFFLQAYTIRVNPIHLFFLSFQKIKLIGINSNGPIRNPLNIFALTFIFFGLGLSANAQDKSKKKEVNITSTFKPVLKDAAKINFAAAPPTADTA